MIRYLKPIALGVLGVFLAFAGIHLYVDHQLLHVLVSIESVRQQQFQKQQEQK